METAVRWTPVPDLPPEPFQTWRIRTDDDFNVELEGDVFEDGRRRTLAISFVGQVLALAVHDDMGAAKMSKVETLDLPKIGTGDTPNYTHPLVIIENSDWIPTIAGDTSRCKHYMFVSYTCTVEVISDVVETTWR